jgi:chromosome segregation ATPase
MDEPKTKEDIKNMLKHLDDEYRKANISEKTYKELKERYKQQMSYMDNTINPGEAAPADAVPAEQEKEEKKGGLLGKLFKKKEEAAAEPSPPAVTIESTVAESDAQKTDGGGNATQLSIEMEKLKVMLEAFRDQKKATDESIQSLFEGIGEVRSMSIQNDAIIRELTSKLEKIDDDVSTLRPKEIEKRFSQISETMEKYQLGMEKLQAKTDDMSEKINKISETVKVIGNTENLANLNQNVQRKLDDIREASNYVERLSSKAEKIFIDLKMELEDLVVFKSKQEAVEDAIKEIMKSLDAIGIKFEGYTTKKEMEEEKEDILILNKEQESIKNVMAIVQTNVPEPILRLRKDREDIKLFLDSLDDQMKSGKLKMVDYESVKRKNIEKLKLIDDELVREWKKFEVLLKNAPPAEVKPVVNIVETPPEEEPAAPLNVIEEEKKGFLSKILHKKKKEEEMTGAPAEPEGETEAPAESGGEAEAPVEPEGEKSSDENTPGEAGAEKADAPAPPSPPAEPRDEKNGTGPSGEKTPEGEKKSKKKKIEINMPF